MALTTAALADEFRRIASEADRRGLMLRAVGGVAVYLRTHDATLFARLGRGPVNDIDLVGVSAQRAEYRKLFEEIGYETDLGLLITAEGSRLGFERNTDPPIVVDLFIDQLDMCHRLDLRRRLDLQTRTISLADLLLQKLQIVKLTQKDVVDVIVLMQEHSLGPDADDAINAEYIAQVLADDWGFYYTVSTNLAHVASVLDDMESSGTQLQDARATLGQLHHEIDAAPKSRRWRIRAKIGTKRKWYQAVDEGTGGF